MIGSIAYVPAKSPKLMISLPAFYHILQHLKLPVELGAHTFVFSPTG